MRSAILFALLFGSLLETACAHAAPRSGPSVWQLRGAVVSATDDILRVRHKTGRIVELQIDDRTVYLRNERPDSPRSLLGGTRVVVDVETLSGLTYRAQRVRLFGGGHPD